VGTVSAASTTPRPEAEASKSPLGRRLIWEMKNPDLATRAPSQREQRRRWDVMTRKDGTRVAGPWDSAEQMLDALERADRSDDQ
jgi:hypothetical protein